MFGDGDSGCKSAGIGKLCDLHIAGAALCSLLFSVFFFISCFLGQGAESYELSSEAGIIARVRR